MTTILRHGQDESTPLKFSIVMVTYARDHIAPKAIAQAAAAAAGTAGVEFILVDNNVDEVDRSAMLAPFEAWKYIKLGFNKGVSARNDGALAADGTFILFLDDDAFLQPQGALERYSIAFEANPQAAIVTARHIDHTTGVTPRASFPHTNKTLPQDKPFKTFRFQGNGFCLRKSAFAKIGPMSEEFFYGLEEIDYAYRVIDSGFEIYYDPTCWVVEYNDAAGRMPRKEVEEMRLTNKMIIAFKFLPAPYVPFNMAMFSAYVFYLNRGRINVLRSFRNFLKWASANKGARRPIGKAAQAYIIACGGEVWK